MSSVNGVDETHHLPRLMGAFFEHVRVAFAAEDWGGLRQSHFRLIESIPTGGATITELAASLRMTKQGCGQFVAQLTESGHLRVDADPADRRSRIVRRTAKGTRLMHRVERRIALLEEGWAQQVGERRYAAFRATLVELAAL